MVKLSIELPWARLAMALAVVMPSAQATANDDGRYFNEYVLRAVDSLNKDRGGLGYGAAIYTQDLHISGVTLKASKPPLTMCVAAQVEIIARALEIYEQDKKDKAHWKFLPELQWKSLRPDSLRGKIWMVNSSHSNGTAGALQAFGMGEELPFDKLTPGAFVNLNREKTGHAVVFLGYLDSKGKLQDAFSDQVAGFKYFSSQGKPDNGGLGYRYAFFADAGCPQLDGGKKRDCGVLRSRNQRILNSGQMLAPKYWDVQRRDTALAVFKATKGMFGDGIFDADYFDGLTTDD